MIKHILGYSKLLIVITACVIGFTDINQRVIIALLWMYVLLSGIYDFLKND